eukprot:scaffold3977_cov96-Cylindrotheca_fusiformis.AAC.2
MAEKYFEVAMKSPDDSKVLRIATELQSTAVRRHYQEGDIVGAEQGFRSQVLTKMYGGGLEYCSGWLRQRITGHTRDLM